MDGADDDREDIVDARVGVKMLLADQYGAVVVRGTVVAKRGKQDAYRQEKGVEQKREQNVAAPNFQ